MPQNVQSRVQQQGGAVLRWFHQNRWLLMVTMFAAAVLYYPVYAYGLENLDSLCTPEPYKADLWDRIPYWETQQGRWALRLFDAAVDGMHPPFATVILTCLFMAVAAVLICDLLKLQRPVLRGISVLLLVCSQYVQNLISYRFCSAAYAASFLLAVLAVYCVAAYSCRWAVAVGALCLTFSVALYQSGLGVAAVLCLLVLIFRLLLQPEQMQSVLHLLGRMLLMGVLGMAVYLLVLQVLLKVYGVTLADINGIDQVGVQSILQLPQGMFRRIGILWNILPGALSLRTIMQPVRLALFCFCWRALPACGRCGKAVAIVRPVFLWSCCWPLYRQLLTLPTSLTPTRRFFCVWPGRWLLYRCLRWLWRQRCPKLRSAT